MSGASTAAAEAAAKGGQVGEAHEAGGAAHVRLLLDTLRLDRPVRILDVGASPIIPAPYRPLLAMGGCEIVGFEPNPEAFRRLEETKSARETYFPFAVGNGSRGELKIYKSPGFTSLFEPYLAASAFVGTRSWRKIEKRVPLETVRMDDRTDVGPFDLFKIDIQGGELDVFANARAAMAGTMAVIVEMRYYPIYAGEPMIGGVDGELRAQGFFIHKFLGVKSKPVPNSQMARLRKRRVADQAIDGDVVYVRDMAKVAQYSDGQLSRLAILAASVFESHTLALFCLDHLAGRGAVPGDLAARYVDLLPESLREPEGAVPAAEDED
ncbi:MAG: FkbM family methyltransferase [Rhodobacteraceae bacterium]|nr:FkbM family methyltransferase [Paracoccaceae bacterium]